MEGPLDERTGRVCDLVTLDELVTHYIVNDFDHRNLNEEAAEFGSVVPTSENLAAVIEARLKGVWTSGFSGPWPRLKRIRLQETKRNSFEQKT